MKVDANQEGIGLGLTICKAIIAQNDGEIEVFSEGSGLGSIFAFSMKMESIPFDEIDKSSLLNEIEI